MCLCSVRSPLPKGCGTAELFVPKRRFFLPWLLGGFLCSVLFPIRGLVPLSHIWPYAFFAACCLFISHASNPVQVPQDSFWWVRGILVSPVLFHLRPRWVSFKNLIFGLISPDIRPCGGRQLPGVLSANPPYFFCIFVVRPEDWFLGLMGKSPPPRQSCPRHHLSRSLSVEAYRQSFC